jgi:hypothetical protein
VGLESPGFSQGRTSNSSSWLFVLSVWCGWRCASGGTAQAVTIATVDEIAYCMQPVRDWPVGLDVAVHTVSTCEESP